MAGINQSYSIEITAPKDVIWHVITDDALYRQWCSVFAEGSRFEGSWDEGSSIKFLADQPDGSAMGMRSRIEEHTPGSTLTIRHLGMFSSAPSQEPETEEWEDATEAYVLSGGPETHTFTVNMTGLPEEMAGYMEQTWPLALAKIKELSESQGA